MQLQGERLLAGSVESLFPRLADASFLVRSIPETTVADSPSADLARCSVRPNFSFARGRLDVAIRVVSREPNSAATFLISSTGIGSGADVEATLAFLPDAGQTKVAWTANVVKLSGLLKAVPSGLIRGAAHKVIDDVWAGIEENLKAT